MIAIGILELGNDRFTSCVFTCLCASVCVLRVCVYVYVCVCFVCVFFHVSCVRALCVCFMYQCVCGSSVLCRPVYPFKPYL